MSESEVTGERFMRFHALYREVVKSEFDALEFAEDDLYAFQVLDRAFRSDNQELRNLAAHLQTQREAALETITLRASEINESTRKLKTLEMKVLERSGQSGDLPPGGMGEEDDTAPAVSDGAPSAAAAEAKNRGRRKGWLS